MIVIGVVLLAGLWLVPLLLTELSIPARRAYTSPLVATVILLATIALLAAQGVQGSGTDESVYASQARDVFSYFEGRTSTYGVLDDGKVGWPLLLGGLYWLFGEPAPILGVVFNAGATVMAIYLMVRAAERLAGARVRGGTIVLLSLPFCVTGPSLLREALCWLSLALVLQGLVCFPNSRAWAATSILAGLLGLWAVRTSLFTLVLAAGAVALVAILVLRVRTVAGVTSSLAGGAAALSLALAAVSGFFGLDLRSIVQTRDYLATGVSTGFDSNLDSPLAYLTSLARVALGPFPSELSLSLVWAWVFVNSVMWWTVLIAIIRGRRWVMGDRTARILIFLAFGLLLGYALLLTNYGIVVRLRASVLVLLIPVAVAAHAATGFGKAGRIAHLEAIR